MIRLYNNLNVWIASLCYFALGSCRASAGRNDEMVTAFAVVGCLLRLAALHRANSAAGIMPF